jgi:hypothetical protein
MDKFEDVKRIVRRQLQLPFSFFLFQTPRVLARLGYFLLPLYLTYDATVAKIVDSKPILIPKYPYYWPVWVLLGCYTVAGFYKFADSDDRQAAQQRVLDRTAAGTLKQLQALALNCPDRNSLDTIQASTLSVIVDKTEQFCLEPANDGIISANFMVADNNAQILRLKVFDRQRADRLHVDVPFGNPGAGVAISTRKTVYVRDVTIPDLRPYFRAEAPYRSILSIPVYCAHCCIGVVNVDSTKPDGFRRQSELVDHLRPYVEMIGMSECMTGGIAHGESSTERANSAGGRGNQSGG